MVDHASPSCLQSQTSILCGSPREKLVLRCSLIQYLQREHAYRLCGMNLMIHILDSRIQVYLPGPGDNGSSRLLSSHHSKYFRVNSFIPNFAKLGVFLLKRNSKTMEKKRKKKDIFFFLIYISKIQKWGVFYSF